ncbi:hypothetical protein ACO0QE_002751 [Hanseniaspora vineae]
MASNDALNRKKQPLKDINNRLINDRRNEPDVFKRLSTIPDLSKKRPYFSPSTAASTYSSVQKLPKTNSSLKSPSRTAEKENMPPQSNPASTEVSSSALQTLLQHNQNDKNFDFPASPLRLSPERLANTQRIAPGKGSLGRIISRFNQPYKMNTILSTPERIGSKVSKSHRVGKLFSSPQAIGKSPNQKLPRKKNLLTDLMASQINESDPINTSSPVTKSALKQAKDPMLESLSELESEKLKETSNRNSTGYTKKSVTFANPPETSPKKEKLISPAQDISLTPQKISNSKPEDNSILESSDPNQELMKVLLQILKRQEQIESKLDAVLAEKKK